MDNISKTETTKPKSTESVSFLKKEIHLFGSPFSNKIKEDFYTELSVLLKAGINLKDGLELIQNAFKKKFHKEKIQKLSEGIISGSSLSEILKTEKEFSDYEYYSIKIGEETGTLPKVTEQLGVFFGKKNEQRRQLMSALTYPIIILSTAVIVVVFMLQFVVPMFQDIFRQQNVELPGITKFIISVSEFTKTYGLIILISCLGLFLSRSLFNKKEFYKKTKDKLTLKIPILGKFIKILYLSQFTQAVSLLTSSKVPVVHSIQLVKQMIDFYPLKKALIEVEKSIINGKSLSESLKSHTLFDDKMIALVKVAEETNQNEFIFERLNMQYTSQVEQRSKLLSTLLEPFIIMIVGILVGVILVAMYLPMFRLSSVLG
ncbi:type II secretion system F family protein [Psychroserpens sp.]|uniref:type II secretion system F family protein n=1 Tax=Psychroserpens sp. TaxID=2020870 RepID=UPI002B2671BD|nr:type II secretion system F family protein [Psychroserpens sp.]